MMIWKKPMIMTIIISALLIIIPISVNAAESTIKKTAEFTSESTSPKYDKFEKKINSNGSSYELDDVSVEKIGEEKKTQLQDKTTTQTKSNLSSKSIQIGSTENITVDGKSYVGKVTDVVYQDNTKINRTGEVNGSEDYGLRVDKPTPPSTKSLPYYDAETGQNMNINAPMTELKKTSEQWQKYTYINITVSNYTDTQFMFNNKKINHNGSTVLGSDYYSELIGMAGLSGSNYRVSSVYGELEELYNALCSIEDEHKKYMASIEDGEDEEGEDLADHLNTATDELYSALDFLDSAINSIDNCVPEPYNK